MQNLKFIKLILIYLLSYVYNYALYFKVDGQCKNATANIYTFYVFSYFIVYTKIKTLANRVNSILKNVLCHVLRYTCIGTWVIGRRCLYWRKTALFSNYTYLLYYQPQTYRRRVPTATVSY
jgi:hypothetical protein